MTRAWVVPVGLVVVGLVPIWLIPMSGCRNAVGGGTAGDGEPQAAGGEGDGDGDVDVDVDGCPAQPVDGLVVTVEDTRTTYRICDATVTADDGTGARVLGTVGAYPECTYRGAADAPGTYALNAEKPGYAPAAVAGVTVRPLAGCDSAQTVYIGLDLTPAP